MLTAEQAARKFCVCEATVRWWIRKGKVPGAKLEKSELGSGKERVKYLIPKAWAPTKKEAKVEEEPSRRKRAGAKRKDRWDKEHGDPVRYIWRHSGDMTVGQLAEEMEIPRGMVCRFFEEGLRRYA